MSFKFSLANKKLIRRLCQSESSLCVSYGTFCWQYCQVWQEPRYRRDHRAMRSKFRSRLGLCNCTGALFDEYTQAPPSDIIMIPYI